MMDAYKVLDLKPGASPDEIKAAYRRAALRWHPDRNPSDAKATERFIAASHAYRALSEHPGASKTVNEEQLRDALEIFEMFMQMTGGSRELRKMLRVLLRF